MDMDMMAARQIASAFVTHVTVLLAVNLTHEIDPVLAGMLPDQVPVPDALLDEQVLIDQVIRAPRGDVRVERAIQWFDNVWFGLEDHQPLHPLILRELEERRDTPAIFELEEALDDAGTLLEQLARQTAPIRDVTAMQAIIDAVRHWQAEPGRDALLRLLACCDAAVGEPSDLPSTDVIHRIRFFASEGSLLAGEYLALHFDPGALRDWDPAELADLVRTRYPLLRGEDVKALVATLRPKPVLAEP